MTDTITFHDEQYGVAEKISILLLGRFAELAEADEDSETVEGLLAIRGLVRQLILDEDWTRFERSADRHRAQGEDLMVVIKDAMLVMKARPTRPSSDSATGQPPTEQSSTGGSSSPVARRLENRGRPDLALVVEEAEAARQARAS